MIEQWVDLVWEVAAAPTLALSGVRKISGDIKFSMLWSELENSDGLRFEDICYTKAKLRQLERNYWNQAEVDAAFEKLNARKFKDHTSVSIQMRGQEKDSRSQGFCMQNLVITATRDVVMVDVYYRSTEVLQKFLADLIFFNHKLVPLFKEFGRDPAKIRFKFANVYLSAVFMPIFLRYESDGLAFFQHLERTDPKFYRTCGLATRRFFNPSHNYKYRTRVKQFEYWKAHVDEAHHRELHKLLASLKGEVVEDDEGDDD